MTANKQQKAKITREQLSICTSIKLQNWGIFFLLNYILDGGGGRRVRKNIRSGEPVQNMRNVSVWEGIYIEMSYLIYSYENVLTRTKIQTLEFKMQHLTKP